MMVKKVLVMAGGTGGHVFPALAIAQKLKENGVEVLWLGTRGRMEEMLVPKYGFNIRYIDVKGIRRNGIKRMLSAPFMIAKAVWQALKVIRDFQPDAAVGFGGYASGPGGFAAFLKGIPLFLHEQNAAAGLTNKLLFKISKAVMLGFPGAFEGKKVSVVGNPVRDSIIKLHDAEHVYSDKVRISIVGGSLGAKALNDLVPAALMNFDADCIEVTHQCGKGNSAKVEQSYQGAKFKFKVSDFIDDMDELYRSTDLIICRAGALTVAETSVSGIPAIFVPLPSAVDDHQTKNARFIEKNGGAVIMSQSTLSSQSLYDVVKSLVEDKEKLKSMSVNARACSITDSTDRVLQLIEKA